MSFRRKNSILGWLEKAEQQKSVAELQAREKAAKIASDPNGFGFYEYLNQLAQGRTATGDLNTYQKIYSNDPYSIGDFTDNDAKAMWERYGADSAGLLNYINNVADPTLKTSLYDLVGQRDTFSGYDPFATNYANVNQGVLSNMGSDWGQYDLTSPAWQNLDAQLLSDVFGGAVNDNKLFLKNGTDLNSRLLVNPDDKTLEMVKAFQNIDAGTGKSNPFFDVQSYDGDEFTYLPYEYVTSGANNKTTGLSTFTPDTNYIAVNADDYADNRFNVSSSMNDLSTLSDWSGLDNANKGFLLGADDVLSKDETLADYMKGRRADTLMLDQMKGTTSDKPQIYMGDTQTNPYDPFVGKYGRWEGNGGDGVLYGAVGNTLQDKYDMTGVNQAAYEDLMWGQSPNTLGTLQAGLASTNPDMKIGDLGSPLAGAIWDKSPEQLDSNGLFGGWFEDKILNNKLINGFLSIFPPTAPYMAAINGMQAASHDDLLGALAGAYGAYTGFTGNSVGGQIGDATQLGQQGLSSSQISDILGYSNASGTGLFNDALGAYGSVVGDVAGGLSGVLGDTLANNVVNGGVSGAITGLGYGDPLQGALFGSVAPIVSSGVNSTLNNQLPTGTGNSLIDSTIKGGAGGLSNALTNTIVGNDVNIGESLLTGAAKGLTKNLTGQVLSTAKPIVQDFFKNWGSDDQLPTDDQLKELQFTNPDAYDWYMFGDEMGNLDQTDYSFMNNDGSVVNGLPESYTGAEQGDTNMFDPWSDLLPSDMPLDPIDWSTNSPSDFSWVDSLTEGGSSFDDVLPTDDQLKELQFTNPDAYDWYMFGDEMGNLDQTDYSFMNNDGIDQLLSGALLPESNAGGSSSSGVLGTVKDAVNDLLGGGATGTANSALLYTLLTALMKSKQSSTGNQMSQDAVNMVINSGEKGAPTRMNTNFGVPKTAVGTLQQLAPTNNGVFQLGLTRN